MSPAHPISDPLLKPVDLLFLGSPAHNLGIDPSLVDFMEKLTPELVNKVAVFGTCAAVSPTKRMARLLSGKGIDVAPTSFCLRLGLFQRERPNGADLKEAAVFAKALVKHGYYL
jgi:hypothetical protein